MKPFKFSKKNQVQAAIPELEDAHAYQRLEVNNNYELANCYARSGNRDKALWGYKESLRANAGYDEIYFNMGVVQKRLDKTAAALDSFKVSAFINPLSLPSFNAIAEIYVKDAGRYAGEGVELFTQAIWE